MDSRNPRCGMGIFSREAEGDKEEPFISLVEQKERKETEILKRRRRVWPGSCLLIRRVSLGGWKSSSSWKQLLLRKTRFSGTFPFGSRQKGPSPEKGIICVPVACKFPSSHLVAVFALFSLCQAMCELRYTIGKHHAFARNTVAGSYTRMREISIIKVAALLQFSFSRDTNL